MMNKDEALKLAMEALETGKNHGVAIDALRRALAERFCDNNCTWRDHHPDCEKAEQPAQKRPQNCGTGYCSCIECVMEPEQPAQQGENK